MSLCLIYFEFDLKCRRIAEDLLVHRLAQLREMVLELALAEAYAVASWFPNSIPIDDYPSCIPKYRRTSQRVVWEYR